MKTVFPRHYLVAFLSLLGLVGSIVGVIFGLQSDDLSPEDCFLIATCTICFALLMSCLLWIQCKRARAKSNLDIRWDTKLSNGIPQLTVTVAFRAKIREVTGNYDFKSMQVSPVHRVIDLQLLADKNIFGMPNLETHSAHIAGLENFLHQLKVRPNMLERRVKRRRTVHEESLRHFDEECSLRDVCLTLDETPEKMNEKVMGRSWQPLRTSASHESLLSFDTNGERSTRAAGSSETSSSVHATTSEQSMFAMNTARHTSFDKFLCAGMRCTNKI